MSLAVFAAPAFAQPQPMPSPPPAEKAKIEEQNNEVKAAIERAEKVLRWVEQERARIRREHVAKMTGHMVVRDRDRKTPWTEKQLKRFDDETTLLKNHLGYLPFLAQNWHRMGPAFPDGCRSPVVVACRRR
jgi:hypothetical protein